MIYFLQSKATGLVKIGTTKRLAARVKSLTSATGEAVVLLGICEGGFAEEKRLHVAFSDDHVAGEWFRLSPAISAYILKYTRAWSKADDQPGGETTLRIPAELFRIMKAVAALRDITVSDYFKHLVDTAVRPHLAELAAAIVRGEDTPKSK